MKSKLILAGALAAAMSFSGGASHAAGAPIVALPGAAVSGNFGLPIVAIQAGDTATYANLDVLAAHNVLSVDTDGVKRAWCNQTQANNNNCPLFYSGEVILAGETDAVDGTAALAPGDYVFICQPHGNMTATLRVI